MKDQVHQNQKKKKIDVEEEALQKMKSLSVSEKMTESEKQDARVLNKREKEEKMEKEWNQWRKFSWIFLKIKLVL